MDIRVHEGLAGGDELPLLHHIPRLHHRLAGRPDMLAQRHHQFLGKRHGLNGLVLCQLLPIPWVYASKESFKH